MVKNFLFGKNLRFFSYEEVSRWIPFSTQPQVVEDTLANFSLYPNILPSDKKQTIFLQAALREYFRRLESRVVEEDEKLIFSDSILPFTQNLTEALLIILDGCEPQGVVNIVIRDKDSDIFLATVIAPQGEVNLAKKHEVLSCEVDFQIKEKQKLKLLSDEMQRIPLPSGERAKIKIHCASNFRLQGKSTVEVEIRGSELGIVFDGRGRPMNLPSADPQGRERILSWQNALGMEVFGL